MLWNNLPVQKYCTGVVPYCYYLLRSYCIVTIIRNIRVFSIAIKNTTRQRVTKHDTLFTKEVYLITIAAVRTYCIDTIGISCRCYRTGRTPLYELTALTTNLNYVCLTVTLTKINKQERIRHQWFTCNWVQLTEHFHIVKQSTTLNCKFDTVSHLISCELTTKCQLLTRTCNKLSIDELEACCLLTKNTVEFSNRLCLLSSLN